MALALPDEVAAELSRWAAHHAGAGGLRPLAAESLHVTLCFLGNRPAHERATVHSALAGALGGLCAPLCAPGELTWLPARRPRVLALSLRDADGALCRLQRTVAEALAQAGVYRPERRRFRAHITLARARRGAVIDTRALQPRPPAPAPWHGERVCLFASLPARGARRYERLVTLALGRAQ